MIIIIIIYFHRICYKCSRNRLTSASAIVCIAPGQSSCVSRPKICRSVVYLILSVRSNYSASAELENPEKSGEVISHTHLWRR